MQQLKSNRGRQAKNEEMADILHGLKVGEMVKVYGATQEIIRLANSLSRTRKRLQETRLMTHALKSGGVRIACVSSKKPKTVIVI